METSEAVRVHVGVEAERLIAQVGRDRLLESRFVVTRPDGPARRAKGEFKARWCIRGYLDPDLLELETPAPTLSAEGLAIAVQLLASKHWVLNIGDVEAAFLRGKAIKPDKGRVLVHVPDTSIPNVAPGSVIELYGLADAPVAWFRSFSKTLQQQLGCKQSQLDPCVFHMFHPDTGGVQGVLALHDDDMLVGGMDWFMSEVVARRRKIYPFKNTKVGSGEFVGRMLTQQEDSLWQPHAHYFSSKWHAHW